MVMMDNPSPMQVGREFVRQYYTLLNKAPAHLHRFYSTTSSYVHGEKYCDGEPETPIVGQADIHRKIDSLKFQDCHTKIRQVDALPTLANGVVIQVTGELSNSGLPLRRFMQTFVLAPQGENPFKFYVLNDIFRYQDDVFYETTHNEQSEDENHGIEEDLGQQAVETNEVAEYEEDFYQQAANDVAVDNQPVVVMTNGIKPGTEGTEMDEHEDTPTPEVQEVEPDNITPPPSPTPVTEVVEHRTNNIEPVDEIKKENDEIVKVDEPAEPRAPSKPFTWAALASKNTHGARAPPPQQPVVAKTTRSPNNNQPIQTETAPASDAAPRPSRGARNQRPPPRDDDRGVDRQERRGPEGGRGSGIRYPDNQQIFVGNLPYDMSEGDLRSHFADFGTVIEVRINVSQSNNPNFGFVIFEQPKSVESVLSVMPTHYKGGRINIEEKKQRNNRDRDGNRRMGDPRRGGMGEGGRGGRRPPPMRRERQGSRERPRPSYNNGPRR